MKGTTEDEMVGWHHLLDGQEFEQAPGDGEGQERLACCSPWSCKDSDMNMNMRDWTTTYAYIIHIRICIICMHICTCIMNVLHIYVYIYAYIYIHIGIWNDAKQTNKMVTFKEGKDSISKCHQVRP